MAKQIWICECHGKQFETKLEVVKHETIELLSGHLTTRDWTEGDYESILEMLDAKKEVILSYYEHTKRNGIKALFELNDGRVAKDIIHHLSGLINSANRNADPKTKHNTVLYSGLGFDSIDNRSMVTQEQKAVVDLLTAAGYTCSINWPYRSRTGSLEIQWLNPKYIAPEN